MTENNTMEDPTFNSIQNKELTVKNHFRPPTRKSVFKVEIEDEIKGMGVLENGIPYLTSSGLAELCGVASRTIRQININWDSDRFGNRERQIQNILIDQGYEGQALTIPVILNGVENNVFPDTVSMAILEYYAFITKDPTETAKRFFRILARTSFRLFIYKAVNYVPQDRNLTSWKHFHDRTSLISNKVPYGFFCIFKEISGMIVDLIRNNVPITDKIVPDISVGISWSKYWANNQLEKKYGNRMKYEHNYPDYYPQSITNPQDAWAYPNKVLGVFRDWFETTYLVEKYPRYIEKKLKDMSLTEDKKKRIKNIFSKKQINDDVHT